MLHCMLLLFAFISFVCAVFHDLFAFSLGVINRLCFVIVALPGHLLYYMILFVDKIVKLLGVDLCGMCAVFNDLFALSLDVINRLIVAFSGQL